MAVELKALTNKRGQIKGKVTRFQTFVDNPLNKDNIVEIKSRLSKLEETWTEFETVQDQIEVLDTTTDHSLERDSFESLYFGLFARVTQHIETAQTSKLATTYPSETSTQNNSCHSHSIPVKLPTINLPKFSGRYEDWVSFFDTFTALIDQNENLSEVQKLHYLKASLSHDAAKVLNSLELTATNYTIAITLLKEQFQNNRLIVQNHIKALFDVQSVQRDNPPSLKHLITTVQTNLRALQALDQQIEAWDQLIIHLITTKLDTSTHREWELTTSPNELPTLKQLTDFLQKRCQVLENIQKAHSRQLTPNDSNKTGHTHNKPHNRYPFKTKALLAKQEQKCGFCNGKHLIYFCQNLKSSQHGERIAKLTKGNICINCLTHGHKVDDCYSRGCKHCGKKHHTVLHIANKPIVNPQQTTNDTNTEETPSTSAFQTSHTVFSSSIQNPSEVLLSTAIVDLISPNGNTLTCRAFLDTGSQSSFLTESVCQKLGLEKEKTSLLVTGIGHNATHISHKVQATLQSKTTDYNATVEFFVLPKITSLLPSKRVKFQTWNIPKHVKLADPTFFEPNKIDVLLGQELFFDILAEGKVKQNNMPILQNTALGWIIGGRTGNCKHHDTATCHLSVLERLDNQLQMFWKLEEPLPKLPLSKDDKHCEEQFNSSVQRAQDGRYTVRMPVQSDTHNLGASRASADRRFTQLEKRFIRNPYVHKQYCDFMRDYEELQHMERAEDEDDTSPEYYLPHHPVLKESSTTTKMRVVFDASAKTSTSVSLNDILMVGPTVQDTLMAILLRFRMHLYVMSADIEKMYRQIWVDPTQRNLLKVLWRENNKAKLQTFRLKTVTYGTACAPYLATRTLNKLAVDESDTFPEAAKVVMSDFYVDDLLTGTDCLSEGVQLQKDMIQLLGRGGFHLRKWNANHDNLLNNLPPDMRERHPQSFPTENSTMKALGVLWDAKADTLKFTYTNSAHNSQSTKRTILSKIASLFDPLGLLSPIVIKAKILMQELWKSNVTWDEKIPAHLEDEWLCLQTSLQFIGKIQVPRGVKTESGLHELELHGFSDASERAYGAAVYVRQVKNNGTATTRLLYSKSKVAPVRAVSLPRLELCGALLLAEIMDYVKVTIRHTISKLVYWTDSSIVISWISSHASRWKTFVANRIGKIQELTRPEEWRHVRSQDNPADLVSRGTLATDLLDSDLWWTGPQWLSKDDSHWPIFPIKLEDDSLPENKTTKEVVSTSVNVEGCVFDLINKCSTLQRLQRTMAYNLRFIHNCRSPDNKTTGPLTPEELDTSLKLLIKQEQTRYFAQEIRELSSSGHVKNKSKLITLHPFKDNIGIIRVGGRLNNADIEEERKHPIVLHDKSRLTQLIVEHEHLRHLHASPQLLLAAVRQRYWPLNGRNICRKVAHQCIICFKSKPRPSQPIMGSLPKHRTAPSRPFSIVGIDYCGPIYIRSSQFRKYTMMKSYIAIFVCFSTRAIHLELVTHMTTDAFIAAFKRFTARRGVCSHVYSDNGTNFIGANRELQELSTLLRSTNHKNKLQDSASTYNIRWHFIPPNSPHFGGLWEAGVKSVKHHLRRTTGNAHLTYEQYYTTLTMIEACLNSRPLTPLSSDPNDPTPLTPGHFLTGDALTSLPELDLSALPVNRLSHWQRAQQLTQHFWKRWSTEYLSQLQQRQRWPSGTTNIQPGQVVVIKDDNLPPLKWVTAIVKELHPGTDGHARVATLLTSNGHIMKRAVNRLCVLPINA